MLHSSFRSAPAGRRSRTRGFTIAEVMVASLVMALAITSSITTLEYGFRAIDNARYTTLAGQILQSQMEKIRLLNWAQLTNTTTGPGAFPTFTPDISATTSAQLARFTCQQSLADAPAPFNGTMKIITLTATWTGIDNKSHSLSYQTRYAQNGLSDFFYTSH